MGMGLTWIVIVQILVFVYLFLEAPQHGLDRWTWALVGLLFGFFAITVFMLRTNRIWHAVFWFVLGLINLILFIMQLHP